MNYVADAAELFLTLNPEIPILSPFDYLLIAEWEKQEIPLIMVLDAIRELQVEAETDLRPLPPAPLSFRRLPETVGAGLN